MSDETISTEELVRIVSRLQAADGTEEELDGLMLILERELPDPEVSNLIFFHIPPLSPEEVVAKARAYRPIEL